ncbi:MAG: hypothetical protein P1V51_16540 [Deltaproteobacteria bacterium]|nr:hypothetical protein [Deltaproteobacteria bacterium]
MNPEATDSAMTMEGLLTHERPVLFVEFVNADQFPGRINARFPLVSGYFRSRGVPTRWIRFGVSTLNLMENDRDEITLTEEELARLLALSREHAPALVVITDALHRPQLEALRAAAPGVQLLCLSDDHQGGLFHETRIRMQVAPGLRPFYGFEPGNAAAEQRRIDNVYLLTTEGCGHHLQLAINPRLAQLDLSSFGDNLGCTFCTSSRDPLGNPKESELRVRNLRAWIEQQVETLAEDRRAVGRLPNAVLFERLPGKGVQEACLEALGRVGLDDELQVLFAVRTNRMRAFEERMEEHFAAHPDSPLCFGIYASGIESFSDRELELYNKGATSLDSVHAFVALRRLSHRYPDRFWYTGLSFLLFTPWTSLDSLHLNVGLMMSLGISRKESGNIFQSRLRLHEGLPLKLLAEQEGLLVDEVSDPVLVMNRRKLFSEEHPWRYADPRLEPLTQIVLRFDLLEEAGDDPVTGEIAAALAPLAGRGKVTDDRLLLPFLLALVEEATAAEEVLELPLLLRRATARLAERLAARAAPAPLQRFRLGHALFTLPGLLERLSKLGKAGPAIIALQGLEPRDDFDPARALLVDAGYGYALDEERGALLLAADSRDLEAWRGADALGRARLQGLPACCAEAAARAEASEDLPGGPAWRAWGARLEHAGALPETLLPLVPALDFARCSPDCAAADRILAGWLEALGLASDPGEAHLLGLEVSGSLSSFRVRRREAGLLHYDPGTLRSSDPELLALLQRGDRLRQEPAQIQILAGDRLLACLTATHALWEAGAAPEDRVAEVWRELGRGLALRQAVGQTETIYQPPFVAPDQLGDLQSLETGAGAEEGKEQVEGFGRATHPRGLELLRQACAAATEPVGDLSIEDCWLEDAGLGLRVSAGDSVYTLLLVGQQAGGDHLLSTGRFLLKQPPSKDDALRSGEHRAWVGAALRAFDRLAAGEAAGLIP